MEFQKALMETTGVAEGFRYYEHTYFLNDAGKLIAFKKEGESTITVFNKPMMFYTSRRKFKDVTKQEKNAIAAS